MFKNIKKMCKNCVIFNRNEYIYNRERNRNNNLNSNNNERRNKENPHIKVTDKRD